MKTLLILLSLLSFSFSTNAQNRESDSLALIQIYNDMGGEQWTNNDGWLSNLPLEDWNGITIQGDRVDKLRLFNVGINGIFSEAIYDLTALTSLDLFNGTLSGQITEEIYNLTDLRVLALTRLGLSGEIPDLADMTELDNIRLSENEFSGVLPTIPQNSSLVRFAQNNLTGSIPMSWANNELTTIDISFNDLEGSIDIFSTFPNIRGLDVDGNNWDEGPLPEWLDDIPSLINFFGSEANFVGDIPAYDFSNSPNFNQIIVNSNALTGDISNLSNGVSNLLWLDARNNLFEGELPLDKFESVGRFNLSNNNYTTIAEPNAPNVYELTLSGNAFRISTLLPHIKVFDIDSLSTLRYNNQKTIFEDLDTTIITPQILTLDAGDEYEGIQYQWIRNNQEIEGATSRYFDVDATEMSNLIGRYDCIMTHPDLIDVQENLVEFERGEIEIRTDFTSSISDEDRLAVQIFPNPFTDHINIVTEELALQYSIMDINGTIIKSNNLKDGQRIEIRNLKQGIYYLKLQSMGGTYIKKVIKM